MFVIHPPNHLHAFAHYHTFPCSLSRLATTLTLSKSISVSSSGSGPAVKKKKMLPGNKIEEAQQAHESQ